ncbi:hypothetical protein GQ85_18185 [Rhodococcus rhodochrous]|nr:hypothetical protein GQ85_18185 [Rhodococcus rhodochrous]
MAQQIPDEREIAAFAKKIGALDDAGNYTEPRSKLAFGAMQYRDELAKAEAAAELEAPVGLSTVEQLARFHREAIEYGDVPIRQELADALLVAVAGALVRREGLSLREEGTPHNE